MSAEVYGMAPARRRMRTPCQQQQSAPHAALLMIGESDPYASNVKLLAHFEGTDGSQTFTNSATNTNCGNGTAQGIQSSLATISTARSLFGSSSLRIGNSGGQAWCDFASTSSLTLGTGDFTLEFAFWPDALLLRNFWDQRGSGSTNSAPVLYADTNGAIHVWFPSADIMASANGALSAGAWNRIAYTRTGTTGNLYVGGTRVATGTDNKNYTQSNVLDIPSWTNNSGTYINCNFDEVRITTGVARYTGASYTLATGPFPNP